MDSSVIGLYGTGSVGIVDLLGDAEAFDADDLAGLVACCSSVQSPSTFHHRGRACSCFGAGEKGLEI